MKWISGIKSKMTAALMLFIVLALVLLTNFGERNNAVRINTAVVSLYEDRLVVGSYIFDYAIYLQHISETAENTAFLSTEKKSTINNELQSINKLHDLYLKTVLTPQEKKEFELFRSICKTIEKQSAAAEFSQVKISSQKAMVILKSLSALQVAEGKMQLADVTSLHAFSNFYSYFELAILIIIALIIQALVLASRKNQPASSLPERINLN